MSEAFFLPAGDGAFDATPHTRGPWSDTHQHGGPPSALALRVMETLALALGAPTLLRITVDLLRPVPMGRLVVSAEASPEGRGVRRIHASLVADGVEVVRAAGLFAALRPVDVSVALDAPPPPGPETAPAEKFAFFRADVGYHTAMDLRYARGALGQARVFAWMKMRVALVLGETPTPAQRVLVAADSGNGVTAALDFATHSFVNPDLTVALHREPVGEWIGLEAEMRTERSGVGVASTVLWDESGPIGRGTQTLLVRKTG